MRHQQLTHIVEESMIYEVRKNGAPRVRRSLRAFVAAVGCAGLMMGFAAVPTPTAAQPLEAQADESPEIPPGRPLDEEFLSQEAREAVAEFLALVEPILRQFENLVADLPQYEAPEILPNGDILIRRKRSSDEDGGAIPLEAPLEPGETTPT